MSDYKRSMFEKAVLGALVIYVLIHVAIQIHPWVRDDKLPFVPLVVAFAVFTLGHAIFMLGWKRALALFGMAAVTSVTIEMIGTKTFWLFGAYAYNEGTIGYELFGEVPFTIPLAWFTILYTVYVLANLIVDGQPTPREGAGWGRLLWLSILTATMMAAYDMVMDPYMVEFEGAWTWYCPDSTPGHLIPDCSQVSAGEPCCNLDEEYAYFGIPLSNFAGWFGGALVNIFAFRALERVLPLQPLGWVNRWVAAMPIFTYLWLCVSDIALAHPSETMLIAPLALGMPVLASAARLVDWAPRPPH